MDACMHNVRVRLAQPTTCCNLKYIGQRVDLGNLPAGVRGDATTSATCMRTSLMKFQASSLIAHRCALDISRYPNEI